MYLIIILLLCINYKSNSLLSINWVNHENYSNTVNLEWVNNSKKIGSFFICNKSLKSFSLKISYIHDWRMCSIVYLSFVHTRNKYRSWWSPLRAEILTIFPSFRSSRVGLTKSTVPPRLSWTSRSFLNFSMRFIASLACLAAVDTKWRASETLKKKNQINRLPR